MQHVGWAQFGVCSNLGAFAIQSALCFVLVLAHDSFCLGINMGNSGSGGIHVSVGKGAYAPGETVTGTVSVNILNPIRAKSITVRISGKEKCRWNEQRTRTVDGRSETYTVSHSGNHRILETIVPVMTLDENMAYSGQFQYPFSFVLPANLPGTTYIQTNGVTASVYYSVQGRLNIVGMLKSDLKFKQPLVVRQAPPFLNRLQANYSGAVTVFCCVSKGMVTMNIAAEKNAYQPGEQAGISASIDNQSRRNFKRIVAELKQVVEVSASGSWKRFEMVVAQSSHPGIERMQSDLNRQLVLQIPPTVQQNCQGYIVKMHYSLNVRADVAWGRDPTCKMPLVIYYPDNPVSGNAVQAPLGYAPSVKQPVAFVVTNNSQPPPAFSMQQYGNVVQLPLDPSRDVEHVPSAPVQQSMAPIYATANPVTTESGGSNDFIRRN